MLSSRRAEEGLLQDAVILSFMLEEVAHDEVLLREVGAACAQVRKRCVGEVDDEHIAEALPMRVFRFQARPPPGIRIRTSLSVSWSRYSFSGVDGPPRSQPVSPVL